MKTQVCVCLSLCLLCTAVVLCFSFAFAQQQSATTAFTFTTIDHPGATCTQALGINNSGQIVGAYWNCGSLPVHGFLLDQGTFTTIDVPGATVTQPDGINDSSEITGFCEGDGCALGGSFLRDKTGNFSMFRFPSSCSTIALGLNNSVQIVGSYTFTCSGSNHGFLLSGGSFSTFDFPSSAPPIGSNEAIGNNNHGDIVGTYGMTGPFVENHGYLFSGGSFTTIDVPFPGTIRTRAHGINDPPSKTIVGVYEDASGVHGFMLAGGSFTAINIPGAISTAALKVNNPGQIVGYYQDTTGRLHGFLATR